MTKPLSKNWRWSTETPASFTVLYLITGNGAGGECQHSATTFLEGTGQEVSHTGRDPTFLRPLLIQLCRDQFQKGDSEKYRHIDSIYI